MTDYYSAKYQRAKTVLAASISAVTRMGELTSGIWEERWETEEVKRDSYDNQNKPQPKLVRKAIKDFQFSMPLIFPFPGEEALLFKVNGSLKNTTAQRIQALLLRLLATFPPGKLRFTFIDPVALGQNVAPFMHLADYDEALVTSKAWSDPRHIEQRLSEITEQMENVIQKYLRNTYATIEDYNKKAGEVAEPYRFLVVLNFPVNFTDEAARRLVSIVQNGPRCGVYTIILNDTEQQSPYGFNINDLERFSMVVFSEDNQLVWEEPNSFRCFIELEEPPSEEIFNNIINQVGKVAVENSKVEVPFEKILEKAALSPENWWQGSTLVSVQVPLGPIGANKIQNLELGVGTLHHALIAGRVGSGKSTLFHMLITMSALKYSVEEIEFYLIDFKKGVEFKTYALHQLPHARVIAIESEREFGLSVIEGLDAELKRRGDAFRDVGVDSLKDYRPKTKKKLPRIMLIVDEFQEFFNENDAVASKASQILDRIVRQGRAFGIHVVLGSQTLAGTYTLARSTIDQMGIRIALQCSEADSRLILSDDNPAARLLSRPGEAIYNSANGLVEGNNPFQVAWLSDEKQKEYLCKIRELAKAKAVFRPKIRLFLKAMLRQNLK